jgi:hypothetical protein
VVRLVAGGAKEDVQRVADDFCDRAFMREDDVRHADQVFVEERAEQAGLQRLHQRCETGDIREQRSHVAPLPGEIDAVGARRKALGQVGRKIARERSMGALGGRLPPPCFAERFDVPNSLRYCRL